MSMFLCLTMRIRNCEQSIRDTDVPLRPEIQKMRVMDKAENYRMSHVADTQDKRKCKAANIGFV